jgi:hypothetical protein
VLVEQETITALGHSGDMVIQKAPTCTNTGLMSGICDDCGEDIQGEVIPALGHIEVTDNAKAPTCTESGLTEGKHCSVCEEVIVAQSEISARGHTEVTDYAVAPTCTKAGLTEGKHCSVCNAVLVKQEHVAAKGHSFDDSGKCSVCDTISEDKESSKTDWDCDDGAWT